MAGEWKFRKRRNCTIRVAKTKALICCSAPLFSHTRQKSSYLTKPLLSYQHRFHDTKMHKLFWCLVLTCQRQSPRPVSELSHRPRQCSGQLGAETRENKLHIHYENMTIYYRFFLQVFGFVCIEV